MQIFTDFFASWNLAYLGMFFLVFIPALWQDIMRHDHVDMTPDQRLGDGLKWTGIWIAISLGFAGVTWSMLGIEAASLYLTGWVLEKSLALDNLFAFMAIFSAFNLIGNDHKVELEYKILHWGILGAIFFRFLFLGTGAFFVNLPTIPVGHIEVNIIFLLFALIILWTIKQMWGDAFGADDDEEEEVDYTNHWSVRAAKRFFPIEPSIESGKFFVKKANSAGKMVRHATPLFLCLICIEVCDVLFAFDSMPVIVAVVQDPNLMITSSLMACAGLRALYFALSAMKDKFCHLDKAVIGLLLLVVVKLCATSVGFHIDNVISMVAITVIISSGVVASIVWPDKDSEDGTVST